MSVERVERDDGSVTIRPPDEWLDPDSTMTDEEADAVVNLFRSHGALLWLHQEPGDSVRLRTMFWFEPPPDLVEMLSQDARVIAKAVARLGEDVPPEDNPYHDVPNQNSGHWDWMDD